MIEVKDIGKLYGNKLALEHISFSIKSPCIIGLLGKNGAGKSTLMNIVTGYLPATTGEIVVDEVSLDDAPQEVKCKMGYLPEKPPVYDSMSVREFLCYVARLKGVISEQVSGAVSKVIEQTELGDVKNRLIRNLSKGYQQRVGIAQALIGEPEILILDEPTVGLDPSQVVDIRIMLKEYSKDHIIIISSHILTEISEICDRVIILNDGKLIKDCSISEISNTKRNHIIVRVDAEKQCFERILKESLVNIRYDYKGEVEQGCSDWEFSSELYEDDIRTIIFNIIAKNEMHVLKMLPVTTEIEKAFLDLTSVDYDK